MTNAQTKLIAAAIVFGLGSIAAGVGFVAMAIDRYGGDGGPIPGGLAMVAGFVLGVVALRRMNRPADKPELR